MGCHNIAFKIGTNSLLVHQISEAVTILKCFVILPPGEECMCHHTMQKADWLTWCHTKKAQLSWISLSVLHFSAHKKNYFELVQHFYHQECLGNTDSPLPGQGKKISGVGLQEQIHPIKNCEPYIVQLCKYACDIFAIDSAIKHEGLQLTSLCNCTDENGTFFFFYAHNTKATVDTRTAFAMCPQSDVDTGQGFFSLVSYQENKTIHGKNHHSCKPSFFDNISMQSTVISKDHVPLK